MHLGLWSSLIIVTAFSFQVTAFSFLVIFLALLLSFFAAILLANKLPYKLRIGLIVALSILLAAVHLDLALGNAMHSRNPHPIKLAEDIGYWLTLIGLGNILIPFKNLTAGTIILGILLAAVPLMLAALFINTFTW